MTDLARYHRQMILPVMGMEGQRRLAGAHAMIVGCGALGCVVADQLCRAGVGTLTIIDRDVVELTNLQRQTLFDEADAHRGTPKAEAAAARLGRINSQIRIRAHARDLSPANAEALAGLAGWAGGSDPDAPPVGVVIDATDNFETRLLLNDLAVKHAIPFIYAGVVGTRATTMTVIPGRTPCLRCVVGEAPGPGTLETCDTAGVLGSAAAMIASVQATEAIKLLARKRELSVRPTLVELDPWSGVYRQVDLSDARDKECPCCAHRRFDSLAGVAASATATLCGRNAVQVAPPRGASQDREPQEVDLPALAGRLSAHGAFEVTPFALRGVLAGERGDAGDELHLTVFRDGRAIVRGTTRAERARAVCARYLG